MFDVPTALRYAREGRLEAWVHAYLAGGPWANPGLSEGLRRQRRWWRGPLELPLEALARAMGPEPDMEYVTDAGRWAERTSGLARGFGEYLAIRPLIAEYRAGALSVRDGNHRHEAMRLRGWRTCWAIIWYNAEADYLRHAQELARRGWNTSAAAEEGPTT